VAPLPQPERVKNKKPELFPSKENVGLGKLPWGNQNGVFQNKYLYIPIQGQRYGHFL